MQPVVQLYLEFFPRCPLFRAALLADKNMSLLFGGLHVFEHQYLQMFALRLNKYDSFSPN